MLYPCKDKFVCGHYSRTGFREYPLRMAYAHPSFSKILRIRSAWRMSACIRVKHVRFLCGLVAAEMLQSQVLELMGHAKT